MMVVEQEECCGVLLMANQVSAFADTCLGRETQERHI